MESLLRHHQRRLAATSLDFVRDQIALVPWSERLVGIRGARGAGKTTLILQYILKHYSDASKALYVSLDNLYFFEHKLFDLAEEFYLNGGQHLFVDEAHKYKNWSVELKMIYDELPGLKVVFTGSSILQMLEGEADLSRRAVIYDLPGLSFREFLAFDGGLKSDGYALQDILKHHVSVATELCKQFKPIEQLKHYNDHGYYPFYKESLSSYHQRLAQVVNMVIDTDLVSIYDINIETIHKLKQLLYVISGSVPFKPNIAKLSEHIKAGRNTTLLLIDYLKQAQLIQAVYTPGGGYSYMRKPEKIYLGNTNLAAAINAENRNVGNVRETYLLEHVQRHHAVSIPEKGDFLVDDRYTFEVGGKDKGFAQVKGVAKSYIAADMIEIGYGNVIPLWLFGMLKPE